MVANVKLPRYDSKQLIQEVVKNRVQQKDFFLSLESEWLKQLALYLLSEGDPLFVKPLELGCHITQVRVDEESKKAFDAKKQSSDPRVRLVKKRKTNLIGLYYPDAGTDLHKKLHVMRREHKLRACPSCGEDGSPGTLDHYLPKEEFPELSVFFENLTPMCDQCQLRKGIAYKKTAEENASFILTMIKSLSVFFISR